MTTKTTPPGAKGDGSTGQAGGRNSLTVREALHILVAAAAWILFVYWWIIVLPQVRRADAVAAALFIVLCSLATVILTGAWVRYNLWIYRRKGPRLRLTPAVQSADADALGRTIVRPDDGTLRTSQTIVVSVDGDRKSIGPAGGPC